MKNILVIETGLNTYKVPVFDNRSRKAYKMLQLLNRNEVTTATILRMTGEKERVNIEGTWMRVIA